MSFLIETRGYILTFRDEFEQPRGAHFKNASNINILLNLKFASPWIIIKFK
jgi:hypothetical protein